MITKARSWSIVMSLVKQVVRDERSTGSVPSVVAVVDTGDDFKPFLLGRHFFKLAMPCLAPPLTRLCC